MTNVTISRELLERALKADASIGATSVELVDGWKAMAELRAALAAPVHPDDAAVDAFAAAMKAKLAKARAKGRGGWDDKTQCSQQHLSDLLRGHVDKGDPVDVANFCMMLSQRGEGIAEPVQGELSNCVLVPVEPTQEMIDAASEAYMPFGGMDIAIRMAVLSAPVRVGAKKLCQANGCNGDLREEWCPTCGAALQ